MSAGRRDGIVRGLVLDVVAVVPWLLTATGFNWDRCDESSVKTREWKCDVVIGVVNMSYWFNCKGQLGSSYRVSIPQTAKRSTSTYITVMGLSHRVRRHCPRPIGLMLANAEAGSHVVHTEGIHFSLLPSRKISRVICRPERFQQGLAVRRLSGSLVS